MFDYFYGGQAELFSFYRIPKVLFTDARIRGISCESKVLYGLLLDRMSLSIKSGWLDKQGRVYIIFTADEIMEALCCADNKATKLMKELEGCGLIERKRRGLGKPSLIYVKNFISDPAKSRIQSRENHDSGAVKTAALESLKSRGTNINPINTDSIETDHLSGPLPLVEKNSQIGGKDNPDGNSLCSPCLCHRLYREDIDRTPFSQGPTGQTAHIRQVPEGSAAGRMLSVGRTQPAPPKAADFCQNGAMPWHRTATPSF